MAGEGSRNRRLMDQNMHLGLLPPVQIVFALDGSSARQAMALKYAEKAKTLPENTSNENKLILYGLYKQATVGDVNTTRPDIFNQRDRAKWDAWKAVEGKSKVEGMSDYITKVKQLQEEAAAAGAS
ncbi:hypothetical protein ABZP36_027277 [Zizania latifolia]